MQFEVPPLVNLGPNEKPDGVDIDQRWEIDWSHPITRGLTFAVLFNDVHHNFDLVHKVPLGWVAGARSPTLLKNYYGGIPTIGRAYASGSSTHCSLRSYKTNFYAKGNGRQERSGSHGTELSFATGVKRVSAGRRFDVWGNGSRNYFGLQTDNTLRANVSDNTTSFRLAWTLSCTTSHPFSNYAFVKYTGTSVTAYRNGAEETPSVPDTSLGTKTPVHPTSDNQILTGSGYSGGGYYSHFYTWSRALETWEGEAISTNPYQILKPVQPQTFFMPEVAAQTISILSANMPQPGFGW